MRTRDEVVRIFTYQVPNEQRKVMHDQVNAACQALALELFDLLPECAERTLSLRDIQAARMQANAAIALHVP